MRIDLHEILFGSARGMHHVTRYSSVPLVHAENVAEHSWQVAFISYAIALDLRAQGVTVAMEDLLRKAIVHDIDECMSGDIIRSFKYVSEPVTQAIGDANTINVARLSGRVYHDHKPPSLGPSVKIGEVMAAPPYLHPGTDERPDTQLFEDWRKAKDGLLEGQIVALADMLCVVSKCVSEYRMGNRAVNYILRAMYEDNLCQWHDHAHIGRYVDAVFPNKKWSDPLMEQIY